MGGVIAEADVFGRVRPAQKLAAVQALQADGHVVAMIGDGVNDIQALKQADLGIATGSGSDASRSVARIVLLPQSLSCWMRRAGWSPISNGSPDCSSPRPSTRRSSPSAPPTWRTPSFPGT